LLSFFTTLFCIAYFCVLIVRRRPTSSLFPYTTLFRSYWSWLRRVCSTSLPSGTGTHSSGYAAKLALPVVVWNSRESRGGCGSWRSEEHTSELQSRENLVCRLLLEKKKIYTSKYYK